MVTVIHTWISDDRNRHMRVEVSRATKVLVYDPYAEAWMGHLGKRQDFVTVSFFDGSIFTATEVPSRMSALVLGAVTALPDSTGFLTALHGQKRHLLALLWSSKALVIAPVGATLGPPWWPPLRDR